jgi:hypothetical protein
MPVDPAEPDAVLNETFLPPGHEPTLPPRPPTPPTHGLTVHGRVVELPAPSTDPARLVSGPGWPGWYRVN